MPVRAVLTALALTLTTASIPSAAAAPQTPTTPAPRGDVTSRVDVDGDGRADTTTFRYLKPVSGKLRYELTVRTARGRVATLPVTIWDNVGPQPASDFWVGVTGIDGVRGNEIVLDLVGGIGDANDVRSYAWRDGKITLVPAAGATSRAPDWRIQYIEFGRATGYTFSQSRAGVRYVVKHDYVGSSSGRTFTGTDTRYRWAGTGWRQLSVTKATVNRKTAASYVGLRGLTWR